MKKRKILIIDDDIDFSEIVKISLESTGLYKVETEADPENASMTVHRFSPDLILLDVIMPNKEGPDVVMEFKNDPLVRNIPVVFLTATVTQREVEEEDGIIGGHPFVAKPSSFESLLKAIDKNLIAAV